jgi:REP element-mobilizing transposase RayT
MDSINSTNKRFGTEKVGHQYHWEHFVFVTKYRRDVFFRYGGLMEVVRDAFYVSAEKYGMTIKELSFGDDYEHVHLEVSMPNTMSVSTAAQLLKGYSSYVAFRQVPEIKGDYWGGNFWSSDYGNGSVGPRDEKVVQNYIRKQDVFGTIRQKIN